MNCRPNVYNAIVYDIGSATILGGQAGNLTCDVLAPSLAASTPDEDPHFSFDESRVYSEKQKCEIAQIVDDQYRIMDPSLLSSFLDFSQSRMGISQEERPETTVLYTQPAHLFGEHNNAWQKVLAEVSFETLGHRSVSIVSDAVLATYAHCAQSAVVVDFGWSCVRVIPVIEGHVETSAIQVHPIGGYALSEILIKQLEKRSVFLRPKDRAGQVEMIERRTCVNMLEGSCSYAENTIDEDFLYFVDGRPLDVQFEMKLVAAIHFNELKLSDSDGDSVTSLPHMIKAAIDECPDHAKRQLWANIVTSGGFSKMTGFIGRLHSELEKIADPVFKVSVQFPMSQLSAGKNTVWTGGSIFASCDRVFGRFCVTKDEWNEVGEPAMQIKSI